MTQAALQTGLTGMQNSYRNMMESANQVVHGAATRSAGPTTSAMPADAITPLVEMMVEERLFTASAAVVSSSDRTLGTLLDVVA